MKRPSGVRIALLIEGETEVAFLAKLREFLATRLSGRMPAIRPVPCDGLIPRGKELQREVERLIEDGFAAVIALTDVYTGDREFPNAAAAKSKLTSWSGNHAQFFAHAAQFDFEAWLLPYWDVVRSKSKTTMSPPQGNGSPENVNHLHPPSHYLRQAFSRGQGKHKKGYRKLVDGKSILRDVDLMVAVNQCAELRLFINTILRLCGGDEIPEPKGTTDGN